MVRRRHAFGIIAIAAAVLATAGVAMAVKGGSSSPEAAPSTTTTEAPTTTGKPTTTTAAPTTTTTPPPPPGLQQGASGPQVEALQRQLQALHLDPGPVDGQYGSGTAMAVYAFQKAHSLPVEPRVSPQLWKLIQRGANVTPMMPDGGPNRVEIDLARQILMLYRDGQLRLFSHISTGNGQSFCEKGHCGVAVTPGGSYRFTWRFSGWRTSDLGRLYNPVYFNGGIAVHGALSVPTYPASHGCVRIPMHIAEYFPSLVSRGDPVYVFGGRTAPTPLGGSPPPESTTTTTAPPSTTTTTTRPSTTSSSTSTTTTPSSTTPTTGG